jgi:hypothetical protein
MMNFYAASLANPSVATKLLSSCRTTLCNSLKNCDYAQRVASLLSLTVTPLPLGKKTSDSCLTRTTKRNVTVQIAKRTPAPSPFGAKAGFREACFAPP